MTDVSSAAAPVRRPSRLPWLLVALLIAFVLGLLGQPWFESQVRGLLPASLRGPAEGPAAQAELKAGQAALEARVSALEQRPGVALPADLSARLAALEAQRSLAPAPAGGPDGFDTAAPSGGVLDVRLAALENRLGVLDQTVQAQGAQLGAVQQSVGLLDGRMGGLSASIGRDVAAARAAVAVIGLRRAVEEGRALSPYLGGAAALLTAGDADLATLQRLAAGVPTAGQLAARYRSARPQVEVALSRTNGSWTEQAMANLRALVTVKGDGAAAPATAQAGLVQLDERLAAGDISGAVVAARALPAVAQRALQGWLAQAQSHLAARTALARVEGRVAAGAAAPGTLAAPALTAPAPAPALAPAPAPAPVPVVPAP